MSQGFRSHCFVDAAEIVHHARRHDERNHKSDKKEKGSPKNLPGGVFFDVFAGQAE